MTSGEQYTIVFTDSGLGGLSIMADFYNWLHHQTLNIDQLNLVFFNSLQAQGNGYNRMASPGEKINTFNAALESINKLYQPQIIAIACNTLSAIYPETTFSKNHSNVLEIISSGKSIIQQHQSLNPNIPLFILATPTTIVSGVYKSKHKKVIQISGDNLASLIEFNYLTPELRNKVRDIFSHIKKHLKQNESFSVFLGCTHYAYSIDILKDVADKMGLNIFSILDPAEHFIKNLIHKLPTRIGKHQTKLTIKIESQAEILANEIQSISSLIQTKSPDIASLLKNYKRLPVTF